MILITGASDGLGLQIAKLYKEAGKKVVNISRRKCEYADINICFSLQEGINIEKASKSILEINEPLEIFINCIGVYSGQKLGEITEDEIKKIMSTNLKAPMLLTSMLFERIKKDETDILNVVSTAGTRGKKSEPLYAASKWAERGYTLSLQEELKETNNRVISFCPGGIRTHFSEKALGYDASSTNWMSPEALAVLIKQILDLPKNIEVSEIVINRK
ncbi:MAG: SDR family NAD(P)-dependent oxidoreductase [Candidatus Paceibacterota bacterium]|jgi:short-subunit dehydrogenase